MAGQLGAGETIIRARRGSRAAYGRASPGTQVDKASASSTPEPGPVFVTPQLFERIVASPRALVAIDTPRGAEVLAQFKHFAVRSGNSIYAWSDDDGIASLREGGVSVPGSARLPEALRFIQSSPQFGVYLFHELAAALRFSPVRAQVLALLRQIGRGRNAGANVRKVVLIDARVSFSEGVDDLMERFTDDPGGGRRLRLRDGRWVVR